MKSKLSYFCYCGLLWFTYTNRNSANVKSDVSIDNGGAPALTRSARCVVHKLQLLPADRAPRRQHYSIATQPVPPDATAMHIAFVRSCRRRVLPPTAVLFTTTVTTVKS